MLKKLFLLIAIVFVTELPELDGQERIGNDVVTLGNIANYPMAGRRASILRFRATESGEVARFNWWWRAAPYGQETGYSRGDGGVYFGALQGDTAAGRPDGNTIAKFRFTVDLANFPPTAVNQYRPAFFSSGGQIEAGKIYNLVVQNVHNRPNQNYVSLNGVYSRNQGYRGHGFEINEQSPTKGFKRHSGTFAYMPGWSITLKDGRQIGNPWQYGESHTKQHLIDGQNMVRQVLIADKDLSLTGLHIYATRIKGHAGLFANVFVDGHFRQRVRFDAENVPILKTRRLAGRGRDYTNYKWLSREIQIDLQNGQELTVELNTFDESSYYVPGSVKAGKYTGIDAAQLADEGHAEFSNDRGQQWQLWKILPDEPRDKIMLSVFASGDRL